jgi:hypothetical protein
MPLIFPGVRCLILILIISLITIDAHPQEKVLDIQEELKYELTFGFIKLGYMNFTLSNSRKDEKKTIYNSRLEIKTYPEVPFIEFNQIIESEMEFYEDELYSRKYFSSNFKDKSISRVEYKFNYKKEEINIFVETNGNVEKESKVEIEDNTKYRDKLSWIYESRLNSFSNKNFNIPVFANDSMSSVRYSFNSNKTVINIEKFDYDISVIKLEGISDFTGIFGFKGEFLILLSDDEYRVPIKAYFSSSLGNVVCELISYKKNLWKPPAFKK